MVFFFTSSAFISFIFFSASIFLAKTLAFSAFRASISFLTATAASASYAGAATSWFGGVAGRTGIEIVVGAVRGVSRMVEAGAGTEDRPGAGKTVTWATGFSTNTAATVTGPGSATRLLRGAKRQTGTAAAAAREGSVMC